jgi:hypothetical protein
MRRALVAWDLAINGGTIRTANRLDLGEVDPTRFRRGRCRYDYDSKKCETEQQAKLAIPHVSSPPSFAVHCS